MRYYLDTNVLYNIAKIPAGIKDDCFYSVYGLSEIVAGIVEDDFFRRKRALENVLYSQIKRDDKSPEQLLIESFDYFKEYDFEDNRSERLQILVKRILLCDSYEQFRQLIQNEPYREIFEYLIAQDKFYSDNFKSASLQGIQNIMKLKKDHKSRQKNEGESPTDLTAILDDENLNRSLSILVFAKKTIRMSDEVFSDELEKTIYETYNGLQDVHVLGYSNYSKKQVRNNLVPGRNDYQDIIHLHYLRDGNGIGIVSDDSIYQEYIPGYAITLQQLLALA